MASLQERGEMSALRPMCRGGAGQAVPALVVARGIWTVRGDMTVFGRSCKVWLSMYLGWSNFDNRCRCLQRVIKMMAVVDDVVKLVSKIGRP